MVVGTVGTSKRSQLQWDLRSSALEIEHASLKHWLPSTKPRNDITQRNIIGIITPFCFTATFLYLLRHDQLVYIPTKCPCVFFNVAMWDCCSFHNKILWCAKVYYYNNQFNMNSYSWLLVWKNILSLCLQWNLLNKFICGTVFTQIKATCSPNLHPTKV